MIEFYEKLQTLLLTNTPLVTVTLVRASGSVPQEPGAKMLVTSEGLRTGTIGGGKLENRAVQEALALLKSDAKSPLTLLVEWNLDRDIGMTCGGTVTLFFECHHQKSWQIVVFGAGHVAQALIPLLLKLDCQVTCIDPRPEWLNCLPSSPKLNCIVAPDMPSEVKNLPEDAFVVLITMGHSTDQPILLEILKTRSFPYLGVIGSRAKAVRLKKDAVEQGLDIERQQGFYCPVGLDFGSNHPQEIAISIAAQLIQERDKFQTQAEVKRIQ